MDNNAPPSLPPSMPPQPSTRAASGAGARRKGQATGWKVAVVILVLMLGLSMLVHLGQFFDSIMGFSGGAPLASGPPLNEVMVEDHGAASKIAIVPVEGMISAYGYGGGPGMVESIRAQLERAAEDARVKAVVLKVNSPGGEVLASDEISAAVSELQEKHGKPVVASMGSLAASGGYYVAAPCRWIVAHELTITGSIGVIMQGYNYRGLMDKVGLRMMTFKSGRLKDMMSGSKAESEISPEERQIVQDLVDQTFARFKTVVREGREAAALANEGNAGETGRVLAEDWESYADGRILSGHEAFDHGFVDELGNLESALSRARKLAGISAANVVQYQPVFHLGDLFRFMGKAQQVREVKVDWGVDPPRLRPGLLYFLSPTFAQ